MGKLGDYEDVCSALSDKKAQDIVVLDLGDAGTLADVFVLATGNSEVHMRTLTKTTEKALKRQGPRQRPRTIPAPESGRNQTRRRRRRP